MKSFQELVEYYLPDWRQRRYALKASFNRWLQKIQQHTIKLIAIFLAAVLCFLLVFGMANYFWFTFRHTQVGAMFLASNPPEAILAIFATSGSNLFTQAFRLTLDTAVTCLLIGLCCQLTALTRYLYLGRGLLNRLIWSLLCAGVTSLDLLEIGEPFNLTTGMVLYFLPACCLTDISFELTALLLPEIWIVLKVKDLRQFCKVAKVRNATNQSNMPCSTGQRKQTPAN